MSEQKEVSHEYLLELTTDIVSSHVSNNLIQINEISALIDSVYTTLSNVQSTSGRASNNQEPFVPVKKSITPDYLICLEDGKKLKMLKRYLKTAHSMTPDQYRKKWGLPNDYPMVAPNYAKTRSKLAKDIGLGKKT